MTVEGPPVDQIRKRVEVQNLFQKIDLIMNPKKNLILKGLDTDLVQERSLKGDRSLKNVQDQLQKAGTKRDRDLERVQEDIHLPTDFRLQIVVKGDEDLDLNTQIVLMKSLSIVLDHKKIHQVKIKMILRIQIQLSGQSQQC